MRELIVHPAAFIRLDIAPALVSVNEDPQADRQRVIVTDAYVYRYSDTAEGPALVGVWELGSLAGSAAQGWVITAGEDDGDVIRVSRSTNCLCGSLVRSVTPFPGVAHVPQNWGL